MNRYRSVIALAFAILFIQIFQACDCQRIDCEVGYLYIHFLSKSDGSNLYENGTYQSDSLKLYLLSKDSSVTDYSHQLEGWQFLHDESGPYFSIDRNAVGYILQFNSQERDTLDVSFTMTEGSKCCSGIPVVTYGIYRGDTISPDEHGRLILKK